MRVVRVARDPLRQILEPCDRGSRADFDVVLPGQLRLRRPDETREGARHHEVVRALSRPDHASPDPVYLIAAVDGVSRKCLVIHVVGCRPSIEVCCAIAPECRETDLVSLIQMLCDLPREVCVSIAVPAGI